MQVKSEILIQNYHQNGKEQDQFTQRRLLLQANTNPREHVMENSCIYQHLFLMLEPYLHIFQRLQKKSFKIYQHFNCTFTIRIDLSAS